MRLGISLPTAGDVAGPEAIRTVAQRAEAVGYDTLWVFERLLYPTAPRSPYPGTADGKLPAGARRVLDTVGALTFAAACTSRIRLGSSIINVTFYNPTMLARELTTLDVLSNGRLTVGFGTGWSADEYEATGVDMATRGARTDEAIDVINKLWTEDEPEHKGRFFTVPRSVVIKPVQRPRPPVLMAAYTPATMKRVAEKADGWNPVGIPGEGMKAMWAGIKGMAQAAGRDPSALQLVVRANLKLTAQPLGEGRPMFVGSEAQIREDALAVRELGAHELFFDPQFNDSVPTLKGQLELLEQLWSLAR